MLFLLKKPRVYAQAFVIFCLDEPVVNPVLCIQDEQVSDLTLTSWSALNFMNVFCIRTENTDTGPVPSKFEVYMGSYRNWRPSLVHHRIWDGTVSVRFWGVGEKFD